MGIDPSGMSYLGDAGQFALGEAKSLIRNGDGPVGNIINTLDPSLLSSACGSEAEQDGDTFGTGLGQVTQFLSQFVGGGGGGGGAAATTAAETEQGAVAAVAEATEEAAGTAEGAGGGGGTGGGTGGGDWSPGSNMPGDTPVYRSGGTNPGSLKATLKDLSPGPRGEQPGVSFDMKPFPGNNAMTTVQQLVDKGFRAINDVDTHVAVTVRDMEGWVNGGNADPATTTLQSIVVKSVLKE